MMLKTKCEPFGWWIDKIRSEEPLTFVRYGDGELNGMVHVGRKQGGGCTKNCDGHTLRSKALRDLLRRSVRQPGNAPNYYRGLWMDGNCKPRERLARDHLDRIAPGVLWWNALAIQAKLNAGKGYPYFKAMRNLRRPVVLIGPRHLRHVNEVGCFDYDTFVQVPYHRAFFAHERIVEEALSFKEPAFYSVHAGPASPVICWKIWKARGNEVACWDLGSILDGFCSAKFGGPVQGSACITRKHWKRFCTQEIINKNLGKRR